MELTHGSGDLRRQGLDFDQVGHRSTLGEMIQMDGYFPIEGIDDRLPFRVRTLRKWARNGPFTACFMRVLAPAVTVSSWPT